METGHGIWNLKCKELYRPDSVATAARELARYTLGLVVVQELGCTKGARKEQVINFFFREKEKKIMSWEQDFLHHRTVSSVKRVEFVRDKMSHIDFKGRWCNNIVLNVHAPM